jgi:hypothetical protein
MELQNIEILTQKYLEGETSLKEEDQLRNYYLSNSVAPHLESYKPLFTYFAKAKKEQFTVATNTPQKSKSLFKPWMAIAASVVLIATAIWYNNGIQNSNTDLGTYEDPELALQKTKAILNLVSAYMNEGNDELVYLKEIEITKNKLITDTNK